MSRNYQSVTHSVRVTVLPVYIDDQSSPEVNRYVWAYTVNILNEGTETLQLRSRYWHITDANGRVEEVQGAGVVGEQPILNPGDQFEYTSGCPLATPSGIMIGSYTMETESGRFLTVEIPAFSLDVPDSPKTLN